jgi:hypothetical protein
MSLGAQRLAPAVLTPEMTRNLLCRRFYGPQVRSGRVWKASPPPPGFDPRIVQLVVTHYSEYDIQLGCLSILK